MKLAVTYENGLIFQHFGHTEQFKVYTVEGSELLSAEIVDTDGFGHGSLAELLSRLGVSTLICGGIGGGAQMALQNAGIKLYGGVSGSCDEAVKAFLAGRLEYNPNVRCSHHEHDHSEQGHSCGNHGCGSHGCGKGA